jgi:hypothetical protein
VLAAQACRIEIEGKNMCIDFIQNATKTHQLWTAIVVCMPKTFVVNVAGHVIVNADEEEQAIQLVKQKLAASSRHLGANSGFRVESATEIIQLPK